MTYFVLVLLILFSTENQTDPCRTGKIYYSLEEALSEPDSVRILDLAMQDPKLTAVPTEVGQFPNLICLDVSFNRVSSIPEEIKSCSNLRVINLAGNRYLSKFPEILKEVPSLETADFTAIPEWSEEKCTYAKEALPGVHVLTDK